MNEQLQIQVGVFLVTVGKRPDPIRQMVWRRNDNWRSQQERERPRFPLADDGRYIHSHMPPEFVFERNWHDYTVRVVLKKHLARIALRSRPARHTVPLTSGETP